MTNGDVTGGTTFATGENQRIARGEAQRLGRATMVMAVGTTLSRLTGVVRILALAYALGSRTALSDSYNLANTIPNIVNDIVLGGIVSATFIPVFVERLATRTEEEAWEAISAVASVTLIVLAAATAVFFAITPLVITGMTALNHSAQAAQSRHLAIYLLLLFVPQLTCYGFVSLATALLNARRRFATPMFAPVANNLVLIAILFWFATLEKHASVAGVSSHRSQLLLLGLGTTLGVVAQAFLMIPSLRRAGLELTWRPDFKHEAVRTILRLSSWTFGLVVANQVALLVVLAMSEHVGQGAVTAYTYAYTFFQLPYGIVAVSIMAATAPELTHLWTTEDHEAFRKRMAVGMRSMLAVIVPAAAGLIVMARPGVALLLAHGASTPSQTVPTATALAMLALGLPGFCVFLYSIRVLQSIQDLRSAFWLYVLENGVNIVLAVALAGPLGVRGIALSIAIAYTVAAVAALVLVRERVGALGSQWIARPLAHVLVSCVALVVGAALGSNVTASERGFGLLARVALGVVAGAAGYFVAAGLLAHFSRRDRPSGGPGGPTSRGEGRGAGPGGAGPGGPGGHGLPAAGGPGGPTSGGAGTGAPGRTPAGVTAEEESVAVRGPQSAPGSWRTGTRRGRRQGGPPPPEPLAPAGRPPYRPKSLGPTRPPGPGRPMRGRLDE